MCKPGLFNTATSVRMPAPGCSTVCEVNKSLSVAPGTLKYPPHVEAIGVPGNRLDMKRVMPGALVCPSKMLIARAPAQSRVVTWGSAAPMSP